jgi:hypothetical protein
MEILVFGQRHLDFMSVYVYVKYIFHHDWIFKLKFYFSLNISIYIVQFSEDTKVYVKSLPVILE